MANSVYGVTDEYWDNLRRGNVSERYPYGNYRSTKSKTYASDTWADLVESEYEDYQQRFQPYERKLLSLADSEALLDEQLSRITANTKSRFNLAQQNVNMMNQRYGIQSTQRENNYNQTQMNAQRGLAISQAKNASRMAESDRRFGILSGAGATRQTAFDEG